MLRSLGTYQASRISVTTHKPETLRPFDNCYDATRRAQTPLDTLLLSRPFREPGL